MADVPLMRAVLRALPEFAALLLVGDVAEARRHAAAHRNVSGKTGAGALPLASHLARKGKGV
jgi:hypothetical protein